MPEETLRFATLDPYAEDEESLARLAAYGDCWSQAFFEGRLGDRARELWLEASRADGVTMRAAYAEGALRPPTAPVATYSSWGGQICVDAGRVLDLHMISDVTVEPTHRRRGVLRRLISDDLADAAARGLPLAALTASEATIYGRFGFGPATRSRQVRVDASARFALRHPPENLRVEVLAPGPSYDAVRTVDAAALAGTRGAVAKPAFYAAGDEGRVDWSTGEPDRTSRVAVVLDADERPTGYARFTTKHDEGQPGGEATVKQLHALDDASYLRLWQLLASLDLVSHVTAEVRTDDLLELALTDPRVVRTQRLRDQLWLRVLDPVAALPARPWRDDGRVVLEVEDPLGHAAGRFALTTRGGTATVSRSDDESDVHLDAATLGTLYLGDRTVAALAAAGRVRGPATGTFAAMADHAGPVPWCTTDF